MFQHPHLRQTELHLLSFASGYYLFFFFFKLEFKVDENRKEIYMACDICI